MPEATFDLFDPEKAIERRIEARGEDTQFKRLQEEGKKTLPRTDSRTVYALRQIEIAERALEQNGESDFEYTRMAEGYYLLGQFRKAYETTRDPLKKQEYETAMMAGNVPCNCPRQGKIDPRFLMDSFPGKFLWKCSNCLKVYVC